MHDDVVNLMFPRLREHLLESRAVGVAPRLAAVHELGGDDGAETVCLPFVRFTLSGYREAVALASSLCLLGCRYPDVGDGRHRDARSEVIGE